VSFFEERREGWQRRSPQSERHWRGLGVHQQHADVLTGQPPIGVIAKNSRCVGRSQQAVDLSISGPVAQRPHAMAVGTTAPILTDHGQ
jgi:hypothetical protein